MVDLTKHVDSAGKPRTRARLLDLVPGRTGAAYTEWLKARNETFRAGIKVATLDPFHGYKNAIDDQLEDIEPEARQKLIKRSFQHPATRAIQPAIWVPHDELGVATDEIRRTGEFSRKIWITSVNARVDANGRVLYRGLPPDRDPFENIEV